jgi:hypothetical protein
MRLGNVSHAHGKGVVMRLGKALSYVWEKRHLRMGKALSYVWGKRHLRMGKALPYVWDRLPGGMERASSYAWEPKDMRTSWQCHSLYMPVKTLLVDYPGSRVVGMGETLPLL